MLCQGGSCQVLTYLRGVCCIVRLALYGYGCGLVICLSLVLSCSFEHSCRLCVSVTLVCSVGCSMRAVAVRCQSRLQCQLQVHPWFCMSNTCCCCRMPYVACRCVLCCAIVQCLMLLRCRSCMNFRGGDGVPRQFSPPFCRSNELIPLNPQA